MMCWREEWEIRQADLLHCIRSFQRMTEVWSELSKTLSDSHAAYAHKQSATFKRMETAARCDLKDVIGFEIDL